MSYRLHSGDLWPVRQEVSKLCQELPSGSWVFTHTVPDQGRGKTGVLGVGGDTEAWEEVV